MMKGVIICAVFTALVNGACFLTTVRWAIATLAQTSSLIRLID
jgi:uncharacterized protein (DUF2062 family)